MSDVCSIEDCGRPLRARGWCSTHYSRWRLTGSVVYTPPTLSERFWRKVDQTGGPPACWPWLGAMSGTSNYGITAVARDGGRLQTSAHRVAYTLAIGEIPDGMVIDHLCRNPICCNPAHLEPVTPRENALRGESPGGRAARTNQCKRGHEFTPENTETHPSKFGRGCRTCRNIRRAARNAARSERMGAGA